MPSGHIRTGLVATFAVIFGIVQIVCACLPETTNVNLTSISSPASHQMMADMNGHDHNAMKSMLEEMEPSQGSNHDHGEHDHEADCSHCDNMVVLAVNADIAPSVVTTPTINNNNYLSVLPHTRANMAATNLAGLRWLDPPRQLSSPDPVSLHTRSLI